MTFVVSLLDEIEVALQRSARASLAMVATALMGSSANEAFSRAYRAAVAVVLGKPVLPAMMGPVGTIAAFGPFTGTGGSPALTVATKLVTAGGNIASADVYIASLAAFAGLCAALMRQEARP